MPLEDAIRAIREHLPVEALMRSTSIHIISKDLPRLSASLLIAGTNEDTVFKHPAGTIEIIRHVPTPTLAPGKPLQYKTRISPTEEILLNDPYISGILANLGAEITKHITCLKSKNASLPLACHGVCGR